MSQSSIIYIFKLINIVCVVCVYLRFRVTEHDAGNAEQLAGHSSIPLNRPGAGVRALPRIGECASACVRACVALRGAN